MLSRRFEFEWQARRKPSRFSREQYIFIAKLEQFAFYLFIVSCLHCACSFLCVMGWFMNHLQAKVVNVCNNLALFFCFYRWPINFHMSKLFVCSNAVACGNYNICTEIRNLMSPSACRFMTALKSILANSLGGFSLNNLWRKQTKKKSLELIIHEFQTRMIFKRISNPFKNTTCSTCINKSNWKTN